MKHILFSLPILLAACSQSPNRPPPQNVVIQSQPIERPPLNLPGIDRLNPRDVEWIVVTPDNVDQVFAELQRQGKSASLFAVDAQGYENIAINTQQTLRTILQQQAVIEGYEEYYLVIDARIQDHNSRIQRQ